MATDFAKPLVTDNYALLLEAVRIAINDLARGLEPTATGNHANTPIDALRWNAANARWERFNGIAWPVLALKLAHSISGNADTATTATHVAGGSNAAIVVQTGSGSTGFVAPSPIGSLLVSNGGAAPPVWINPGNITVGGASSTSNVSGVVTATATPIFVGSQGPSSMQAQGNSQYSAVLSFHRTGAYAINMGLDTDNVFRIGGWSDGASRYRMHLDANGVLTATGDVQIPSDERLKKDWVNFEPDFLRKLCLVKNGTYTRIDKDITQPGVSAQDLQRVLPQAVAENADGYLQVSYANAALAICVELAKAVVGCQSQLSLMQKRIEKLEGRR